ncbi:MAG: bifunctional (p)ppGpp synthetase/guanosine-3',5'-bis(diphosphate) 3'-pyrophosphohydrolase [Acidobacteriota bacterium]
MIRYEDIEEKVRQAHPDSDLKLLRRAYLFSARMHQGQVRYSGEPYLNHPLEVANILAELRLDVATVSVGLLHDVVEDTYADLPTIREYFGEDVARMVDGVTKISKIRFSSQAERQAENFRKLLLAMVDDIRVILVKLADRLHNMRTLDYLPVEKQKRIARETLDIYAPIALRLGMARIRGELEDLAFKYLDPVAYEKLAAEVEEKRAASEKAIERVQERLAGVLREQGIDAQLQSRVKRLYSIYQKMRRQHIDLNRVYDFIAVRVIVNSIRDCYTVLGIVNNLWTPIPGRIKDFIAMPRNNMYQSLHTTVISEEGVPFEVQIRTHEMHRVAEEGIAAHWKYKEGKLTEEGDDKRFMWLRHLLEWQREVRDPHQFLSNLKIDLYPDEVYVFTPRGEVMTLPKGATALDFAYYVHTEVGHKCVGAKVNQRIVPLKYRLNTGDIVEILTASDAHPKRDWLNIVRTQRARAAIRRWLNQRRREEAVEIGRRLLEKELRLWKRNLRKYEGQLAELATQMGVARADELLAQIGIGKLSARQVVRKLVPELGDRIPPDAVAEGKVKQWVRRLVGGSDTPIQVRGHEDLLVYRARCCNPIKGEDVVGYITVGRGISVHSVHCPNVPNLLQNPERRVEVQWNDGDEPTKYPVRLKIRTEDRTGLLADITGALSQVEANILDARAKVMDAGEGLIDMTIEVRDTAHLEQALNHIKQVAGVLEVERSLLRSDERKQASKQVSQRG